VTADELEELLTHCPTLFHMAERGSWQSIRTRGLLSTSALLDLYAVEEPRRSQIERERRPAGVEISANGLPDAVIRDQIPMTDAGLRKALPDHMEPSDWYALLNRRVFFWLTGDRLHRLMCAGAYRNREHDVLEVDARSLVEAHRERIRLCPYNSGSTVMKPVARDESTFAGIDDYPYGFWRGKRSKGERAVELAVDYSVPDICDHVRRVLVRRGREIVAITEDYT